jgi:aconitate hydratase
VLPLQLLDGATWKSLGLKGDETVSLQGVADLSPRKTVSLEVTFADGKKIQVPALCRIDTENELDYFKNGGILHYVLRNLAKAAA